MQKIINELINNAVKGADHYRYKNSTWVIFSDDLKWVVELTDGGWLWFNSKFFMQLFQYVSLEEVTDVQDYITNWANEYFKLQVSLKKTESSVNFKNGTRLRNLNCPAYFTELYLIVSDGVKQVEGNNPVIGDIFDQVEHVIENGIKKVHPDVLPGEYNWKNEFEAEKVVFNGTKI